MNRVVAKIENVDNVVSSLRGGGLIIAPTDTCYAAVVAADNQDGIEKLLAYKQLPADSPIPIAVNSKQMARRYAKLTDQAESIYDMYLPGKFMIVSAAEDETSSRLTGTDNTIGIRIPDHDLILEIISRLGKAVTITSALPPHGATPYSWEQIQKYKSTQRLKLIDVFVDAGQLPRSDKSTVINTIENIPVTIRGEDLPLPSKQLFCEQSSSVEQTVRIGERIGQMISQDDKTESKIILLQGQLGAGKTQLTRGLVSAWGEQGSKVTSPSYSYINEYKASRGIIAHCDLWRLPEQTRLADIGLDRYLNNSNTIIIEWANRFTHQIQQLASANNETWIINITQNKDNGRIITCYK